MRTVLFSILIFFTKLSFAQNVTASFTAPDTVCFNSSVNIQNTSQGATNYYWNFCTANINQSPIGTNLGNPGGSLSAPVYIDYVFTNGNYYGFVTNNYPGGLLRLDFGNSLLNAPAVTNLGNVGGAIPNNTEGVQIANDNGKWYVLIVGGDVAGGSIPSLTTVSIGTNITNNTPTATNWGNIGNLSYPHDLYVFNDNGHWYGLTVNYSNSTVTRFDLTNSLANSPSATNLGNIGNLSGPTGIQAINDNGNWRVFVTNATSSTLTRLDFGSSLLNSPTGVNLGNPNNAFVTCWDIYILRYCGENEAFVINANGGYNIIKLDFGSSLINNPTAVNLGNQGNLSFPHSLSKLFRVGADVFSLITNVNNNTLSLLQFPGCTSASIPNSTAQNPPPIKYNTPGTYNINLTVDDGLPTQTSYCKQVVVQDINISKSNDSSICAGSSLQLTAGGGSIYSWSPSSTLNNQGIANPIASPLATTKYYVTVSNAAGCSKMDSILITVKSAPVITKSNDTSICYSSAVQLLAGGGTSYSWAPSSSLNNPGINNPVATPLTTTLYYVTVTNSLGCSKTDSIAITVNSLPVISKSKDTAICNNTAVQLSASGGTSYVWTPAFTLNNPDISNPIATPSATTTYYVTVTNTAGCSKMDSIKISTSAPPVISKSNDLSICKNTSVQLFASGGSTYFWSPASSLNNAGIPNPVATPAAATTYYVTVTNSGGCSKMDSVKIGIDPVAFITKSNDTTICSMASVRIFANGGASYLWSPASSLDNSTSPNPIASPTATTLYKVAIKDIYSCNYEDSVKVSVRNAAIFTVSPDVSVCSGTSKQLQASGGDTYIWSPAVGLDNPNISNPMSTSGASITYTVTIHANTCNETGTLSTNVTVLPLPDVNATSSNDLTCSLGSSQLNATGAANYTWSPATGLNNSNIANPVAAPSNTTIYKVIGKDNNGCANSDTVTVKADFSMNALYLLPNSFTPNDDGINDCFGIKYWGQVDQLDFNIYNRFGERVFHTNNSTVCWDGMYKGQLQEAGAFVYIIKAKTACGNVDKKGTVMLLR